MPVRLSRRRWVAVGAVVTVVAAAGTAISLSQDHTKSPSAGRPAAAPSTAAPSTASTAGPAGGATTTSTSGHFINAATGTVLYVAGSNILERLDLDPSTTRSVDLPPASGPPPTGGGPGAGVGGPLAVVGDRVILQLATSTVAFPTGLDGPPVSLGDSVGFIPSWRPGRLWLVSVTVTGPAVREIDTAGHATAPPSALPVDWSPVSATGTGVLLTNTLGFEVWDPLASRVVFKSPPQAQVVAAHGSLVAWQLSGCFALCALHLANVTTGTDTLIYPQPTENASGFQSGGISPDGRYLAAAVFSGGGQLAIVDLQTRKFESVALAVSGGPPTFVWSPSGQWVFALDSNGNPVVYAHKLGTIDTQTIHLPPVAGGVLSIAAA